MSTYHKQPNLESVTTINEDGSKFNIHPADVKGKFTLLRRLTGWTLVLIYALLPWIKINGYPAVFIDLDKLQFHFFGLTLFTANLWIFCFFIAGLAYMLFVLSSIVGRVWCGWFCPFTVFLEHIYRRAERLIEGNAIKRRKLDESPWNMKKILIRGTTWLSYVLISLTIANIFLSYFLSPPKLLSNIMNGPAAHPKEFIFVLIFTAIFTFMFGWFREQFCIILCPYGRFQSALTDDDTITVFYDFVRGEPRGKKRKKGDADDQPLGDCVDCRRCISVCPTGIDIRNGLQLECIACSACIDACDEIMVKVKRPKGLIRYDSLNGITKGKRKILRPRLFLYLAFALLGTIAFVSLLPNAAGEIHADITRMRGPAYSANADGVRNTFHIVITNKLNKETSFSIDFKEKDKYKLIMGTSKIKLAPLAKEKIAITVLAPYETYSGPETLHFTIKSDDGSEAKISIKFLGPSATLFRQQFGSEKNEN